MYDLAAYESLLKSFLQAGYRSTLFSETFGPQGHLFLRHDIDLCLDRAREMASCETALGVRATYFILLDTEFYNVFNKRGRAVLRDLQNLGHEVGLHFDFASVETIEEMFARVTQECRILEDLVGTPIRAVAPHRPVPSLLDNSEDICGRVHPYQPRFFSDIHYASDSLGGWTRDHPTDCAAFRSKGSMQLLTHPYIWTTPTAATQTERIRDVLRGKSVDLDVAARANFRTYLPD